MLQGIDRMRTKFGRKRKRQNATITPAPGMQPIKVAFGDHIEFIYEGELRRVQVLAIWDWGIRGWDADRQALRGFSSAKIGATTMKETNSVVNEDDTERQGK